MPLPLTVTTQLGSLRNADRTTCGISYPDKQHEDEYVNVNYSRVKYWSNASPTVTTQLGSLRNADRTTRGISYPDKQHKDEYVNVNYSRVKFSRTVANREYCEN